MKRLKPFILLSFVVFNSFCFAQNDISKLKLDYKSAKTKYEISESLIKIITYYNQRNKKTDSTIFYNKKLELLALSENDESLLGESYRQFAHIYYFKSDYDKVFDYSKKSITLLKKFDENKKIGDLELLLGNTNQILFKNTEAILNFKEAEQLIEEKRKVNLYIGYANTYSQMNAIDRALLYYNKAYNFCLEHNISDYQYDIFNGMAVTYNKNGDVEKCIESLEKALAIANRTKYKLGKVIALHNIAYQNKTDKKYKEAKKNFESAITIFDSIDNDFIKASSYLNYAEVILFLGNDYSRVENNLYKAETIYDKINSTSRIPYILNVRAKLYDKKGDKINAIKTYEKAIALSSENEISGIIQKNYFNLFELYETNKNFEKALDSYKNFNRIKDSIASRKKIKEIETLKINFEVAQIENDLLINKKEVALLNAEKNASNYKIVLLCLFILSLLIFVFRQRKLNKTKRLRLKAENELIKLQQEKLNSTVSYKNKEITEYAVYINERNRILEYFSSEIRDIRSQEKDQNLKSQLNNLQFFIEDNLNINKEKIELNSNIKNTEESFIFRLKEKHPNLTSKELKVATYLLLDLPSKTISKQMNITIQSVNNYRFSIRKKIGLDKKINISEYLKSLSS